MPTNPAQLLCPSPKNARGFCRGKPLASGGYFMLLITSPITRRLYEGRADGADERGDEGGAQSPPQGIGEADRLHQGGQEGGGDRSGRHFPVGHGGALWPARVPLGDAAGKPRGDG